MIAEHRHPFAVQRRLAQVDHAIAPVRLVTLQQALQLQQQNLAGCLRPVAVDFVALAYNYRPVLELRRTVGTQQETLSKSLGIRGKEQMALNLSLGPVERFRLQVNLECVNPQRSQVANEH